jgi:RND family efflux transporter MFP subunit
LKDELASLRIERKRPKRATSSRAANRSLDEAAIASLSAEEALPSPRAQPAYTRAPASRPRNLGLGLLSIALWLIPLGLVGGGAYFAFLQYQKARPKLKVKVAAVRALTPGEANTVLSAKGYIRSFHQAKLGAKVPGRIAEVRVKENQHVEQGEVLAELEHVDMDKQKKSRELMLERNKAELREAEVDNHFKELKARRSLRLRAQGQMSDEEAEQAQSAYEVARKRIETLKASIDYQQGMIDELAEAIDEMKIKAPFDGTVLEKAAEKGETIVLGGLGAASGRGSVVTLADMNDLEVETDIAENMLGRLKDPKKYPKEQRAEIMVSAYSDRRYHGYLDRIVPLGDRARGTVKVYVKIEEKGTPLFPELVANVAFLPGSQSDATDSPQQTALYIPKAALVETEGSAYVWVVDRDYALSRRPVRVTIDSDRARVDEGLKVGENVILDPPAELAEGQVVALAD